MLSSASDQGVRVWGFAQPSSWADFIGTYISMKIKLGPNVMELLKHKTPLSMKLQATGQHTPFAEHQRFKTKSNTAGIKCNVICNVVLYQEEIHA